MRTLIVCPGRGSYGPRELGSLRGAPDEIIAAIDSARAAHGLGSIRSLDAGRSFGDDHQEARNASALIFAGSLADAGPVSARTQPCAVIGNSLGFYTALAVSGALPLEEAALLVAGMASLQARLGQGAQLIYPVVDDEWRASPERAAAVERFIRDHEGRVFPSIRLGGFEVLALADRSLAKALPVARHGGRDYPLVLEGHHGYHSPLVRRVAEAALADPPSTSFRTPQVPLVDGRGAIHSAWSTDPRELASYALDHQVREPYDFTTSLRVALRELAPEAIVLLGPGESIGGAIGQVIVREEWQGIASKEAFQARQKESPVLYSMGRPEQRARLLGEAR